MATVYLDRSGSALRVDSGVLIVSHANDTRPASRIPLALVQRVVLRADTALTSSALCALADAGVSLVAMGGRTGERVAQMIGPWHNNADIRLQQLLALARPEPALDLARHLVRAKLRRQAHCLKVMQGERSDLRKPFFDGLASIERIMARLPEATSVESCRGFEGAGAAAHFGAYFSAFAPSLGATGRKRRPPPDPVNASLSLAYTLLYSIAVRVCWQTGLDPAVGALHGLAHGRAAMACDLMEPWRPTVDLWVWRMFQSRELRAEHFGVDGARGCLLGKAGRAHFYRAWEAESRPVEASLRRYARLVAKSFVVGAGPLPEHLTQDLPE